MLSHQGAGNPEDVARERALYERFKADESAQSITGPFRGPRPRTTTSGNRSTSIDSRPRHETPIVLTRPLLPASVGAACLELVR